MRKFYPLAMALMLLILAVPMAVSAQADLSEGCTALQGVSVANDGLLATTFGPNDFLAGEVLTITVTGAGDTFDVSIGTFSSTGIAVGSTLTYEIPEDGTYTVEVTVVGVAVDVLVEVGCTASEDNLDDDDGPVTICHIPPGNPNAAHTITVGAPAVDAHLGHGDTLGPCPDGIETRYDDLELNITIFIIYGDNTIQIFNECDDDCDTVTITPINQIINLNVLVINLDDDDELEFMEIDEPEDFGFEIDDDLVLDSDTSIVIFYLHPDPDNENVGVFQLNIYENNTLVDDNLLIFIDTDGNIVFWTDQGYWDDQIE